MRICIFTDDNSVGSATHCKLLAKGTKIGQRRLTEQMANCTADVRSTVFAEEITRIVADPFPATNSGMRAFHPKNGDFLRQLDNPAALTDEYYF